MIAIAISLALGAVLTVSQPAQQFDLDCTFTKAPKIKGMPAGVHFRINLESGQWCEDACTQVKRFAEVTTAKLVLQRVEPAYRGADEHLRQIDRGTGEYFGFNRYDMGPGLGSTSSLVVEGNCQPTTFSGFPKVETKF